MRFEKENRPKCSAECLAQGPDHQGPIQTGESQRDCASIKCVADSGRRADAGKRRQIRLQVQELTKDVAERLHLPSQQVVNRCRRQQHRCKQDIQRQDVITEVDGNPVANVQSFREALKKADPKRGVLLYLDRKGSKTFAVLKAGD
jgi:S1-C subfamily serine protease